MKLLHESGYRLSNSLSELAVTVPGEAEKIEEISKLLIIHAGSPPKLILPQCIA